MQRDMELVRIILLRAEAEEPRLAGYGPDFRVEGYDDLVVARHIELLEEAGLVDANLMRHNGLVVGPGYGVTRLTWSGHDFLDAARSESVWKSTLGELGKRGLSVSFDVMKALLEAKAKALLGLDAGG